MKKIYFFIVYIVTILNIASILGMDIEQTDNIYSMKKSTGVSIKDLLLQKETRSFKSNESKGQTQNQDMLTNLSKNSDIIKKNCQAIQIVYNQHNETLYFLAKNKNEPVDIFKLFLYTSIAKFPRQGTKMATDQPSQSDESKKESVEQDASSYTSPNHIQRHFLQSLSLQDHYFFYRNSTDPKNTIRVDTTMKNTQGFIITHNTPIIKTGNIKGIIYTGSTWPSIYKTVIQGTKKQQSLFMKNAFLLGCKDNCMIIGKVNSKHNSAFFFWRRLKEQNDVNITLYALFAETTSQKQKDYFDTEIVAELFKQAEDPKNKENVLKQGSITLVKVASHITLTSRDQENPEIYFPKVAISQDKALIVHKDGMQFDNPNPKISIVYKSNNTQANNHQLFKTNAFSMKTFINTQKILFGKHIRLPYFDEIKSVYLAIIEQQPMCVMVTKTDDLGYCADGVYILPFTGPMEQRSQQIKKPQADLPSQKSESDKKSSEQNESSAEQSESKAKTKTSNYVHRHEKKYPINSIKLPQQLWHVDIQYDNKKSTWNSLETIIDSTFDFENNRLFLIVEPKKDPLVNTPSSKETVTKQQLITINLSDFMRDKAIKKENNDV